MTIQGVELDPKKVYVSLSVAAVVLVATGGAAMKCAMCALQLRDDVAAIRRDVNDIADNRWTIEDQERFAARLERLNRTLPLDVPTASEVARERPAH